MARAHKVTFPPARRIPVSGSPPSRSPAAGRGAVRAGTRGGLPFTGLFAGALLLLALAAGGCASYPRKASSLNSAWESGDVDRAVRIATGEAARREGTRDEVLWFLEKGAALRAAEEYEASNEAFDAAAARIAEYEARAQVRVGVSAAATLTNLNALPYEGFAYDKVMLHTYKTLNHLALGDLENARVELNRAYQRQQEAVQENARRIEEAREQAREETADNSVDVDRSMADERLQRQLEQQYAHLEALETYADYVNPFAVYLDALYFMSHPNSVSSDLERSLISFERVAAMIAENEYVRRDLDRINDLIGGAPLPPTTYVLFETGRGPSREEVRIDLPLWGFSGDVPYIGAAFPNLRLRVGHEPHLTVLTETGSHRSERLTSMDGIVAQEFQNEMPVVIAKTLVATATKAASQYAIKEATEDSGALGALVQLGGIVYQVVMNQADIRTWQTLPKEFHLCHFPTPDNRRITLSAPGAPNNIEVELREGTVTVVYVKSISRGTPPIVNQFTFQ